MRVSRIAVLLLLVLAACSGPPPRPTHSPEPAGQRYGTTTTVVEIADHGPMLCFGAQALLGPPSCGTVPITNWDWAGVEGESRELDTTWGDFYVIGTYDGKRFTVAEAGPADEGPEWRDPWGGADHFKAPCREPPNGWRIVDPSKMTEDDAQAALDAARDEPDFAGSWSDHRGAPGHYISNPAKPDHPKSWRYIEVFAFTGHGPAHERELADLWGGPICVIDRAERTEADLQEIGHALSGPVGDEINTFGAGQDVVRNEVYLFVIATDDQLQAELDRRFGPGSVHQWPFLRPVAGVTALPADA